MSARWRGLAAGILAATVLVLAGCSGLPVSGPVFAGLPPGAIAPPDFSFVPLKPQDGATREQIVQGFIDAGIGPQNNWAVAQLYLTPAFRAQWKPNAGATVDDRSARVYDAAEGDKVTLTVTGHATVDATGAYTPSDGGQSTLSFTLAKVGGQWRIAHAPDGIVLGTDQFTAVFRQYPLMYFDPGWHYLVPDVRWFPSANAPTRIAKTLIDGKPSPWLAGSVVSAFPDDIELDPPSVPVSGGLAHVELSGPVLAQDAQTLNRMQTQLVHSLTAAGVNDVTMGYAGTALQAQTLNVGSTRVDGRGLVLTAKGFGFLGTGNAVEPLTGLGETLSRMPATDVQLSADQTQAAVRTTDGAVSRVGAQGVQVLDRRPGLVAPSVDAKGYVWSVPGAEPAALEVFAADGRAVALTAGRLLSTGTVRAVSVSRDGTRLAVAGTVGTTPVTEVFGVLRDADGVPTGLGDALTLGRLPGDAVALTWLDDDTLGVLAASGDSTVEVSQTVGGPATTVPVPDGAVQIAGTLGTTVRLRASDGTLYTQRGANWEQAGTGILVLASAQGTP